MSRSSFRQSVKSVRNSEKSGVYGSGGDGHMSSGGYGGGCSMVGGGDGSMVGGGDGSMVGGGEIGGFIGAGLNGAIYKFKVNDGSSSKHTRKTVLKIQKIGHGRPEEEATLMRTMHKILPLNFHNVLQMYTFPGFKYDKTPPTNKYGTLYRDPDDIDPKHAVSGVVVPRAQMDWLDFDASSSSSSSPSSSLSSSSSSSSSSSPSSSPSSYYSPRDSIFKQVFISILTMNAAGYYHNDIKKDNVFIDTLSDIKPIRYNITCEDTKCLNIQINPLTNPLKFYNVSNFLVTFETKHIATIGDFGLVSKELYLQQPKFEKVALNSKVKLNRDWSNYVSDLHRLYGSLTHDASYKDACNQMLLFFRKYWVKMINKIAERKKKITQDDRKEELRIGICFMKRYFIDNVLDNELKTVIKTYDIDFTTKPTVETVDAQPAYFCGNYKGQSLNGTRIVLRPELCVDKVSPRKVSPRKVSSRKPININNKRGRSKPPEVSRVKMRRT